MSSIPPNMNVAASLAQSQVSQNESAKSQDAQRNKQAADARQLSRLAEQHQDEVETTEEAEHAILTLRSVLDANQRSDDRDDTG